MRSSRVIACLGKESAFGFHFAKCHIGLLPVVSADGIYKNGYPFAPLQKTKHSCHNRALGKTADNDQFVSAQF
jgi:hypothetical protein